MHFLSLCTALILLHHVLGACPQPEPSFPLPNYSKHKSTIRIALSQIQSQLDSIRSENVFDTSSFAIEVTSSEETLWSNYHTAREKDPDRPGTLQVNGSSAFRIASITKVFTVLGLLQQHEAGHLSLDDPIDSYLKDLKGQGRIEWSGITLRSLASQLSGLPVNWPRDGLSVMLPDPTKVGLPPANNSESFPKCSIHGAEPCSEEDLMSVVKTLDPLFAPNFKSSYSNVAFELLGLVIEKATGQSYEDYIKSSILGPAGMGTTTFDTPSDNIAVLPKDENWYFDIDQGVSKPTGGLYSNSHDLSAFMRYVLRHHNDFTTASNWLQPASFAIGSNSYYGMPWEIFRSQAFQRAQSLPVTFYTKGGGLPGYTSIIAMVPEYDLGITILVGGNQFLLIRLLEVISTPLIRTADGIATSELHDNYAGRYSTTDINSTLTLKFDSLSGLHVDKLISNGTDMLTALLRVGALEEGTKLQLVPTRLYVDNTSKIGEKWRVVPVKSGRNHSGIWGDFCITDMSGPIYDGRPLYELIFWDGEVELTGLGVRLKKVEEAEEATTAKTSLVVQALRGYVTGLLRDYWIVS